MCATFTDDDVGKTVVNASGDEIGIVSAVEHGSARVEPDPGITDTIRAKLGWEDTDDDTYPLQDHSVSRVTDDEVHLEQDLAGANEAGAGTGVGTNDAGDRRDDSGIGDDTGITDDSGIGDDSRIGDNTERGDSGLTDDDDLLGDDDDDDDNLLGDDDDDDDDLL